MTPLIVTDFGLSKLPLAEYVSLIAAATNAFNGALLARRPDHYKHFTLIGVIALAFAGGIGGGIARDVLLDRIPKPLVNPWYIIVCLCAASIALAIDYGSGQRFKDGLFQFMTAFTLPWYAVVGAQAALGAHLGYLAAVLIGVIATSAGRWIIDIACNVVPKQLVRGEFFISAAALTAIVYTGAVTIGGIDAVPATGIAVVAGFSFRILALRRGWEEWEPWEPQALREGERARKTLMESIRG